MSITKGLWKRLSFITRVYISVGLAVLFFLLLVIGSCAGGVDGALNELERMSQQTAVAFKIEWTNGTEEEIDVFNAEGKSQSVQEMYLVTKSNVEISALYVWTENAIAQGTTLTALALALPVPDTENKTEDKELIPSYALNATTENSVLLASAYVVPKGVRIRLRFSKSIDLQNIAVGFRLLGEEENG